MTCVGPGVKLSVAVLVGLPYGSESADKAFEDVVVDQQGSVVHLPVGLQGGCHELSVDLLLSRAGTA